MEQKAIYIDKQRSADRAEWETQRAGDAIRRERELAERVAARLLEYMRGQWPGLDECVARSAVQRLYERLGE